MGYFEKRKKALEEFLLKNAGSCSAQELEDLQSELSMYEGAVNPWKQYDHVPLSEKKDNPKEKTGL